MKNETLIDKFVKISAEWEKIQDNEFITAEKERFYKKRIGKLRAAILSRMSDGRPLRSGKFKSGRFVAVDRTDSQKIIASGMDARALIKKAERSGKNYTIAYVPPSHIF